MKKEDSLDSKKNKRKSVIQFSIIIAVAIGLGVTGGIIVKKSTSKEEIDYSDFDPELYKADAKDLLRQYKANPNKSFTPAELVNIGLEQYRQCENSYSIGLGVASTIVEQTIRNAQFKNGNRYMEETISNSSYVHIANRVDQTNLDEGIKLYKGSASGAEKTNYSNAKLTEYTNSDYKNDWGKTLDEMFIYIISDKTVNADKCTIDKSDGLIKVTLDLDVAISSYYYKVQMKKISGLSGLPVFDYLVHTYTFDENMMLKHLYVDEKYVASMGPISGVSIHNTIDYYYHPNEYREIPSLEELVDYSTEGEVKYE